MTVVTIPNYFWQGLVDGFHQPHKKAPGEPLKWELSFERTLSVDALIERVNLLSASGNMKQTTSNFLRQQLKRHPNSHERALNAVYLATIAPESAIQR